jgi:hypothetical protein
VNLRQQGAAVISTKSVSENRFLRFPQEASALPRLEAALRLVDDIDAALAADDAIVAMTAAQ